VKRFISVLFLTTATMLAVGTVFVFSQGKKGQVQDPVCELWVDKTKELSYTLKGETYYFCSSRDMTLFKENPAKYLPKK
jgi:YHS domain-containing protein